MPGLAGPVDGERATLLSYVRQQRYLVRLAAHGLDDDQARTTPSVSSLSVGALIKHLALVERLWAGVMAQNAGSSGPEAYQASFTMLPDETLSALLSDYEVACAATDAAALAFDDPGTMVPIPKGVPWFPQDVESWSVRWILLHLIEETARHAGHADIVREAIDGATAMPLMAAVEGWPASPWMKPWTPPSL